MAVPAAVCTARRVAETAQVPGRRAVPRPNGKEQPDGGRTANACGPWQEAQARGRRDEGAATAKRHSTRLRRERPLPRPHSTAARPTQREATCWPWRPGGAAGPARGRRGEGAATAKRHSTRLQRARRPGAPPAQRAAVPLGRRMPLAPTRRRPAAAAATSRHWHYPCCRFFFRVLFFLVFCFFVFLYFFCFFWFSLLSQNLSQNKLFVCFGRKKKQKTKQKQKQQQQQPNTTTRPHDHTTKRQSLRRDVY